MVRDALPSSEELARRYRKRAEECYTLSELCKHNPAGEAWRRIAVIYETMADGQERRREI